MVGEEIIKLNLGCGRDIRPGWINVDKFGDPGVDRVVDLFSYPWPFEDNSVDEFYASHIVEHIPHEAKPSFNPEYSYSEVERSKRWRQLERLDGFFCFFCEIWRIAKPNAEITVVCPYGQSWGAFQDPTHTRYIVPPSFAYLTKEGKRNETFDYHFPCLFDMYSCDISFAMKREVESVILPKLITPEATTFHLMYGWNVGSNLTAKMRAIK